RFMGGNGRLDRLVHDVTRSVHNLTHQPIARPSNSLTRAFGSRCRALSSVRNGHSSSTRHPEADAANDDETLTIGLCSRPTMSILTNFDITKIFRNASKIKLGSGVVGKVSSVLIVVCVTLGGLAAISRNDWVQGGAVAAIFLIVFIML